MRIPTSLEAVIDTGADAIYRHLEEDLPQNLQKRVREWHELHGLERLDEPHLIVARQAAFNVLVKGTLYEHYQQRGLLPELGSDAQSAFETAEETTDDPAFGEYVLDDVAWLADRSVLEDLIEARHRLLAAEEPTEEIERLFESVTPQKSRRKLGQFRTPTAIADLMAVWITPTGEERVLDPEMGRMPCPRQPTVKTGQIRRYGARRHSRSRFERTGARDGRDPVTHSHNLRIGDFLDLSPDDVDGKVDAVISSTTSTRRCCSIAAKIPSSTKR